MRKSIFIEIILLFGFAIFFTSCMTPVTPPPDLDEEVETPGSGPSEWTDQDWADPNPIGNVQPSEPDPPGASPKEWTAEEEEEEVENPKFKEKPIKPINIPKDRGESKKFQDRIRGLQTRF